MLLAVLVAIAVLLPPRMGDYELVAPTTGTKGLYSRKRPHEATLVVTKEAGFSCSSTSPVRASARYVRKQRGCLFLATEADPHIAPLVLAWSFRDYTFWLSLTKAGFDDDPMAAERRATRASEEAQRWIERALATPHRHN
ncbi:MAG: hypothetical protein AUG04_05730 [Deltaproteobacteria bacterium 13_1_20CM_2_69_21]|nr:MAG: hypothetical protein AUG04_05730 [Deltaproteobacteria bacterium 13_1_20CM_2_69_21]